MKQVSNAAKGHQESSTIHSHVVSNSAAESMKKPIKSINRAAHTKYHSNNNNSSSKHNHVAPSNNLQGKAGGKRNNDKLDPIIANHLNNSYSHTNNSNKKNVVPKNSKQLSTAIEPVRGKIRPVSSSGTGTGN